MNKELAAQAWNNMRSELEERAAAARPKLKSFEAHLLFEKARQAVIAAYPTASDFQTLYTAARAPFLRLSYLKTSKFARKAA